MTALLIEEPSRSLPLQRVSFRPARVQHPTTVAGLGGSNGFAASPP